MYSTGRTSVFGDKGAKVVCLPFPFCDGRERLEPSPRSKVDVQTALYIMSGCCLNIKIGEAPRPSTYKGPS